MNTQPVQPRTFRLDGQIVTNRAQALAILEAAKQDQSILIEKCCAAIRYFTGGACLPPAQPPVQTGQEGSL